jgi:RHS repeat-associated protein
MPMPGRTFSSEKYRFGFNGKENDNEVKGTGNSIDFGARIYDPRLGRMLSVDAKYSLNPDKNPYNYASNNPIIMIDPDGNWDIVVHAYADRTKYGYGLAIVKDNAGNEIYRMNVRLQGSAGSNRSVTNSDTPTGEYDITGWGNYSSINRLSYGPNDLIKMTPQSGEISETGRSGILIHGGRQETENSDGSWTAKSSPSLSKTHGCVRCYDSDISSMKGITDALEASDPNEKPGITTIVDDLILRKGNYYTPDDIKEHEKNIQGQTQGNLTSKLLGGGSKDDFKNALNNSAKEDAGAIQSEQINLQDKKVNE